MSKIVDIMPKFEIIILRYTPEFCLSHHAITILIKHPECRPNLERNICQNNKLYKNSKYFFICMLECVRLRRFKSAYKVKVLMT